MEIPATLYHVQWFDSHNDAPFVEFRFIYRARELLITRGIIAPQPLEHFKAMAESQTELHGKKRKGKVENKLRKQAKNRITEIPSSVPSKSRSVKRAIEKDQMKDEITLPEEEEESPNTSIETDASTSPLVEYMERRKSLPHPISLFNITSNSPTSTEESHIDILRELRELRVDNY